MKRNAELKVSFPQYLSVFSKITTKCSLNLLKEYPLAENFFKADKQSIVDTIHNTARFGESYALRKYDAIIAAAQDTSVFGRSLKSYATRIQLYIDTFEQYQEHLDTIMKAILDTVDNLENRDTYNRIELLQTLHGIGFLSAVVLIAEMEFFDLFSSSQKLYAYFGLDPAVK